MKQKKTKSNESGDSRRTPKDAATEGKRITASRYQMGLAGERRAARL
jgi:hypothetical protein